METKVRDVIDFLSEPNNVQALLIVEQIIIIGIYLLCLRLRSLQGEEFFHNTDITYDETRVIALDELKVMPIYKDDKLNG